MRIRIHPNIVAKLVQRKIEPTHVAQCFFRKEGARYLIDTRLKNTTVPPTLWFIGKTDKGRLLKVVFIYYELEDLSIIKSAYEPNDEEIRIYNKFGR